MFNPLSTQKAKVNLNTLTWFNLSVRYLNSQLPRPCHPEQIQLVILYHVYLYYIVFLNNGHVHDVEKIYEHKLKDKNGLDGMMPETYRAASICTKL